MIHLGDITKIEQAPFVDCITFGSPCQDLSMAGKREGLKGERSGLFMQAVRIIKEMRIRSGGVYPTFAVGKMFPEHSAATEEKISEPCWKNSPGSQKQTLAFLDLRKESGQRQDILPEITSALHGEPLMLNIGESHRDAVESRLSWILEDNVPQRYYLSARA